MSATHFHEDRPENAPELSPEEEKRVEEAKSLTADTTHEVIREEGEEELKRPTAGLAFSGLAAGLSMGFSVVAESALHALVPDAPWRKLIVSFGYSMGFLIVIIAGQQLFTENTLTAMLPLMVRRDRRTLGSVARLWAVVLIANMGGALLFAFVIARSGVLDPGMRSAIGDIARAGLADGLGSGVLRGVFAGWLIAMLVWMLPAAKDMDVLVIVLITWLVSVGGFIHIIAGAVSTFYLTLTGALGWGESVTRFFAPALIGNVIGGVVLVTAIGHAQVTAGGGKQRH